MTGTTIKSAWKLSSITVRAYCKCGAAIHTTVNDPGALVSVMKFFAEDHHGDGHGPCDAKTARKARRKAEKKFCE